VRLHPSHFQDKPRIFADEREKIHALEKAYPHVHIVRPVALGGSLGYYGGEDMDEKSSMMAYSDVFVTVYSTMVVETAVHDRPIISVCIDVPGGWNQPGKFSLSLTEIGEWPTHQRFRVAGAGQVVFDAAALKTAIDRYLLDPQADGEQRRKFIRDECTFTDGSAGRRTGEYLRSLI
jgi:CDP-glycerol glycerophosphotransferase (TagB/SpsB family)